MTTAEQSSRRVDGSMIDEAWRQHDGRETNGLLPGTHAALIDVNDDPRLLLRSARARLARLSLELRAAQHEAEVAERAHEQARRSPVDATNLAAREHLGRGLEARLAQRRAELALEADQARSDAADLVVAARERAAAVVASAQPQLNVARNGALPAPSSAAPSGSRRSRLLHIDVLLPLAAGAIVLVVLLAWLG